MEEILKISGAALIGLFAALMLRERHPTQAYLIGIASSAIIAVAVFDSGIRSAVEAVSGYMEAYSLSQYGVVLCKAVGISYVTSITEGICRDCSEGMLASCVEICGKVQLILLSLPLLSALLEIAEGML